MVKRRPPHADNPSVTDLSSRPWHPRATTVEDRAITGAAILEPTTGHDTARESLSILAAIADYHDDDTSQHAQRVGIYCALIARALELPEPFVDLIRDAAPLHDIGKVGIPDRILHKPGALTPEERTIMMRHVEIGANILANTRSPVLRAAAEIALNHHERWDGRGYLRGLHTDEIPLSARITAIADVFDALTHGRPYKQAWDIDRALAEIAAQAAHQFDPRIAQAFATLNPDTFLHDPATRAGSI